MTRTDLDFLSEQDKILTHPRRKFSKISKVVAYILVIFVILVVLFGIEVFSSGENLAKTLGNTSLWGQIQHLIGSGDKQLQGENDDRINILLLGIGGAGHDGPYLTDTMMLASFKPSTKQVALISIPRDLVVPIPGFGWHKINEADADGEMKRPGGGGELASQTVSDIFGMPIQYYVRIDFSGFQQLIDDLGGVTVTVDDKLDDPMYPIAGKEDAPLDQRYEHLVVQPGMQHMDGTLALKFVRSRHALGSEGSDFARSRRQQKVLLGIKEKALAFETLLNPYRLSSVMNTMSQHISTNMEVWEILRLYNLVKGIDETKMIHHVFDDSPTGGLYDDITSDGAFVLRPKAGNFSEMQDVVQNIFNPQTIKPEKRRVEVQNGTKINGLAAGAAAQLEGAGYLIIRTKNAPTQDYKTTVVYNLTSNAADPVAQNIATLLKANLSNSLPEWVTATSTGAVSRNAEFLVILGKDRQP